MLETIGVPDVGGSSLHPLEFDSVADMDGGMGRGPLYVVDGDGGTNNELLKLDGRSRAVVAHSGTAGAQPGNFNIPHNVVYDVGMNRVWVADRANMRLQVPPMGWARNSSVPPRIGKCPARRSPSRRAGLWRGWGRAGRGGVRPVRL